MARPHAAFHLRQHTGLFGRHIHGRVEVSLHGPEQYARHQSPNAPQPRHRSRSITVFHASLGWAEIGLLAVVAALSHAARLALWKPWRTAHKPILWILHASYAWIVIHLALRALSALELVAASAAIHALTVGAIGGMTLGMMTRTARGHTGRPLETTAAETTAYVLVQLAAATRVLLPIAVPSLYHQSVVVSGLLWTGAFAMFVWQFAPILWQARIDGRPG